VELHGASGNLRDWTFGPAQAIARSNTVLAFDRPGHGLSGLPDRGGERLDVQARLLRGALAQLGVGRVTLVGHSYGGSVALAWALDAPDSPDGLVLLAAPSQVWDGGLGFRTNLLANPLAGPLAARSLPALVTDATAAAAVAAVFAPQPAPEGYLEYLGRDLVLNPASLRANALQLTALKPQLRAMTPRYFGLPIPVEIIHGTADTTVPLAVHSEPLAGQLPRARLTRLDGVGHMPHHAALPELLAALARLPAG
jgi:pimeloyl-ACP methyl ester carboxylesterase